MHLESPGRRSTTALAEIWELPADPVNPENAHMGSVGWYYGNAKVIGETNSSSKCAKLCLAWSSANLSVFDFVFA